MALTKVKINLGTEGNLSGSRSIIQSTKTLVSSSAQIASNISGSITSVSSSTATRIATNLASINTLNGNGSAQGVGTSDSPTFNDVTVTGTLTAQEVHTEFESASVIFTSGSTIFGNSSDDVHNMTGSLNVSGSLFVKDGTLTVTDNVDFNGDLDVDGTTNLDVVDIDGAVDMASTLAVADDITLANNKYYQVKATGGSAIRIAGLANDNNIYLGAIDDAGASVYIREDGSNVLTITGGDVTASGDFAVTDRLTVGAWDNSNSHGHANLNISADANEGADSYLNFAAGLTIKGYISYDHHATAGSQAMKFFVGDAAVQALTIDGDGDVGIGIGSPVSKIDVRGASSTIALNTDATAVFTLDPPDVSNGTYLFGDGSSGGDQVQILAVNDSAANQNEYAGIGFAMKTSGNTVVTVAGVAGIKENDTDGSGGDVGALAFGTRTTGDYVKERMRIASAGNVGIGTNNPDRLLHVHGAGGGQAVAVFEDTSANANVLIQAPGSDKNSILNFGDAASTEIGQIDYDHNNNSMKFVVNTNEHLTFGSDGSIIQPRGHYSRLSGNWEILDVVSRSSDSNDIQSSNCFADNRYGYFKIVIPYIRATTDGADLQLTFLYNSGGGLTEQTSDYYGHKQTMGHGASSYGGAVYDNASQMTLYSNSWSATQGGVQGELYIYNTIYHDTSNFDTNIFSSHEYTGNGDRGSYYRPIGRGELMGYNTGGTYGYARDSSFFRLNTDRDPDYWKGFRLKFNTGNVAAQSRFIVCGMPL